MPRENRPFPDEGPARKQDYPVTEPERKQTAPQADQPARRNDTLGGDERDLKPGGIGNQPNGMPEDLGKGR
jgi:hypothetical protein